MNTMCSEKYLTRSVVLSVVGKCHVLGLQEAAIRLLQDNIEHYCRLLQPAFAKLQLEANVTHCAHGTALVSMLRCYLM